MSKSTTARAIRSRIVDHVRMRAGDLVPHEMNPRTHSDAQRAALAALYEEIGFARSVLGYKLPDGRIKLIDGHLRTSMDPEQVIDVEILDVTDEEARKLLLSLDPLAALAGYHEETLKELEASVSTSSDHLANLWRSVGRAQAEADQALDEAREKASSKRPAQEIEERFLVICECTDERHQRDVLRWVKEHGVSARAVMS